MLRHFFILLLGLVYGSPAIQADISHTHTEEQLSPCQQLVSEHKAGSVDSHVQLKEQGCLSVLLDDENKKVSVRLALATINVANIGFDRPPTHEDEEQRVLDTLAHLKKSEQLISFPETAACTPLTADAATNIFEATDAHVMVTANYEWRCENVAAIGDIQTHIHEIFTGHIIAEVHGSILNSVRVVMADDEKRELFVAATVAVNPENTEVVAKEQADTNEQDDLTPIDFGSVSDSQPQATVKSEELSAVVQPQRRQVDAHIHKTGYLNFIIDEKTGSVLAHLSIGAPDMVGIGFERQPTHENEEKRVQEALAKIKDAKALFAFSAAARCTIQGADAWTNIMEPGVEHVDFDGEFEFHCANLSDLKEIRANVFGVFKGEHLKTVTISGGQQTAKVFNAGPDAANYVRLRFK